MFRGQKFAMKPTQERTRHGGRPRRPGPISSALEGLERRDLKAGNITFNPFTGIVIEGTAANDVAQVFINNQGDLNPYNDKVVATLADQFGNVNVRLAVNLYEGYSRNVPSISFYGYEGHDSFINTTDIVSYGYGGTGNDYLAGGGANDYLNGGDGNDYLVGNGGNDNLAGEAGNDYLNGRGGADYLSQEAAWSLPCTVETNCGDIPVRRPGPGHGLTDRAPGSPGRGGRSAGAAGARCLRRTRGRRPARTDRR